MGSPESPHEKSRDTVDDDPNQQSGTELELQYSEVDENLFEKRRETKFLLKLDASLLVWCWFSYLIKVGSFMVARFNETLLNQKAN